VVDKPRCDQMLSNLQSYLMALECLRDVDRDEFLANEDKIGNTKYHFVIAIETCIDIANHIIASEKLRLPTSNADSLSVLVENGILPADRGAALRAMAQFRNRLVHLYWDVSSEQLYQFLQECLSDFETVIECVSAFTLKA